MLEICFLGTGAMMPLPDRKLAALLLRRGGRLLLMDCGEGTQVAIRQCGWSLARIDTICFTHFHADHIAGLPGLLLTMGACDRTEPVTLVGPAGLKSVVRGLRVIAPELPYELRFKELTRREQTFPFHDIQVTAFPLDHLMPCYGFSLSLARPGRFDPNRAKALGLPVIHWRELQNGKAVTLDGNTYTPDQVLGPPRKGIKLAYCTDTRATGVIAIHGREADLLICEGTYGEDEKADKAAEYGHMTFSQAANLAKRADARELLLTHFSPSMRDPQEHIEMAQAIFPNTNTAHDLLCRTLLFEED
ncbi:MAG: ribonuclease Z [Clostridia bacterium]|nr:ribonuclease Z [Clostridia bacterium]